MLLNTTLLCIVALVLFSHYEFIYSGNKDNLMDTNNTLKHDRNAGLLIEQMQNYIKGAEGIKYLEDDLLVVNINENHKIRIFGTPWTKHFGYSFKAFQDDNTLKRKLLSVNYDKSN